MPENTTPSPQPKRLVDVTSRGGVLTATFLHPSLGERGSAGSADELIRAIEQLGRRLRFLVLDLGRVKFINSSGLGMCIELRNRAARQNARTILYGLSRDLQRLIEITKIERLFESASDEIALTDLVRGP